MKAKVWYIKAAYEGMPEEENFQVVEEDVASPGPGQFLLRALAWSVDPYQRAYLSEVLGTKFSPSFPLPAFGFQVGRVEESAHPDFPKGSLVVCHCGWRDLTLLDEKGPIGWRPYAIDRPPYILSAELSQFPFTYALGVFSSPGMTAYFGLTDKLRPVAGETLVVNGAAGAVGSVVGELGKALGLRVIGFAGSDAKVSYLKNAGWDAAFNYKSVGVAEALREAAPQGVDCFFDNVGGEFASAVYPFLNYDGRVCQCGTIANYNAESPPPIPDFRGLLVGKRLTMAGFHMPAYAKQLPQGIATMMRYVKERKVRPMETIWHGFHNIPSAFRLMLQGANTGKAIVISEFAK